MANTIQIKHGTTVPSSTDLATNELGFNSSENGLYIGKENATPVKIGASLPLDISNGGTSADNRNSATWNLLYGQNNFPSEDTPIAWSAIGPQILFRPGGDTNEWAQHIANIPLNGDIESQYYYHLIHLPFSQNPREILQIAGVAPCGDLYFRASNSLGWNGAEDGSSAWKSVGSLAYPVGAVYMSTSGTSPALLFGGSWEQIQGRFLLGCGTTQTNNLDWFGAVNGEYEYTTSGLTGGQTYHQMTYDEMPSHTHSDYSSGSHTHTGTTDSSGTHSHSFSNFYGGTSGVNASYTMLQRGGAGSYKNLVTYDSDNMWRYSIASAGDHTHSFTTSSSGAHTHGMTYSGNNYNHNNMPPFFTVFMWYRYA